MQEVHSFVCKFLQLSCEGTTASLSFKSDGGNVTANLNATLGSLSAHSSPMPPSSDYVKPSNADKSSEKHRFLTMTGMMMEPKFY